MACPKFNIRDNSFLQLSIINIFSQKMYENITNVSLITETLIAEFDNMVNIFIVYYIYTPHLTRVCF